VRNPDPYGAQYRPTFSPDGQRIAFPAADGSLASVAVSGGPAERITSPTPPGSQRRDADPVYSRSGDWIAFTRAPGRGDSDVCLVRPDGSGLRRLTTTPPPAEPGEPRTGSSALAWSPDGASLLAFRHDHFAVVDVAGGTSTPIARVGVQYGIGPAVWN
jgi:Tol biopolymer transport system component